METNKQEVIKRLTTLRMQLLEEVDYGERYADSIESIINFINTNL